jgi:hypothetical protein
VPNNSSSHEKLEDFEEAKRDAKNVIWMNIPIIIISEICFPFTWIENYKCESLSVAHLKSIILIKVFLICRVN